MVTRWNHVTDTVCLTARIFSATKSSFTEQHKEESSVSLRFQFKETTTPCKDDSKNVSLWKFTAMSNVTGESYALKGYSINKLTFCNRSQEQIPWKQEGQETGRGRNNVQPVGDLSPLAIAQELPVGCWQNWVVQFETILQFCWVPPY